MSDTPRIDLSALAAKWPSAVVVRSKIEEFSGGLYTSGTMANRDSAGDGPPRITVGWRKVAYLVAPLIEWMERDIARRTARAIEPPRRRKTKPKESV